MAPNEMELDPKYDADIDYPHTSPEVKSGHPGHTTPEQDAQVFQLRTQLEQAGYKERLDTLCMVHQFQGMPPGPLTDVAGSCDSSAPGSSMSSTRRQCESA